MVGAQLGSYRIVAKISEGGMGAVYLAEHTLLGRRAAVKVMLPSLSRDPAIVSRFFQEARAATAIEHPGIVAVFDFGYQDGSAYLVMEHLSGETLASRLRRGPMSLAAAATVARQIASAVGAAHRAGVVHRDLKPDNVFLVPDPAVPGGERAKVLDFGIAKLVDDRQEGGGLTRTGMVIGTPAYMAPEQCRGAGGVDHRADIYALGCILFEMLCGLPPFAGRGTGEIIGAHQFVAPPAPRSIHAAIDRQVEALILLLLAKNPADRPQSMDEVERELGRLVGGSAARPVIADAATVALGATLVRGTTMSEAAAESSPAATRGGRPRSSWVVGAALAMVAAVGVVGGGLALRRGGSASRPVAATGAGGGLRPAPEAPATHAIGDAPVVPSEATPPSAPTVEPAPTAAPIPIPAPTAAPTPISAPPTAAPTPMPAPTAGGRTRRGARPHAGRTTATRPADVPAAVPPSTPPITPKPVAPPPSPPPPAKPKEISPDGTVDPFHK